MSDIVLLAFMILILVVIFFLPVKLL